MNNNPIQYGFIPEKKVEVKQTETKKSTTKKNTNTTKK
jgi:hypothetical protein